LNNCQMIKCAQTEWLERWKFYSDEKWQLRNITSFFYLKILQLSNSDIFQFIGGKKMCQKTRLVFKFCISLFLTSLLCLVATSNATTLSAFYKQQLLLCFFFCYHYIYHLILNEFISINISNNNLPLVV
jgi:hypothetical protein